MFKTASKRAIKKLEATGDLIGNKIADKIVELSKTLPKTNLETNEEETLREIFILSELGHKFNDDLRLRK